MEISYLRQQDLIDVGKFAGRIRIIGCGGIGSPTAIILAKMGFGKFILNDDDKVECHNLPNQFYPVDAIGKNKTEALAEQMLKMNPGAEVACVNNKFDDTFRWEEFPDREIVIVAVDSLQARASIWDKCKRKGHIDLYIDARMAAEAFEIHVVKPNLIDNILAYESTLYHKNGDGSRSLRTPVELPCTARAIAYNVFVLSGLIANEIKKFLMDGFQGITELRGDLVERALALV